MCFRRILSMVLAAAFLATTAACSTGSGKQASATGDESLKSGSSKELTMYVMDYDTTTKNAIDKFNASHNEVQIKAKSLLSYPADNLSSKLTYELNNGKAPDIILCEQDTLPNLSVFFGKGCFYDLNTLIENDKTFRLKDYFQKILDYGMYNGKRYIIPLSFKLDALFTTMDLLVKSGDQINETNDTFDVFSEAAAKYMSNAGSEEKFFVSALDFCNLARTASVPFFDLEKKTASFEAKEFIDLLNKYKSVAGSICPSSMTAKSTDAGKVLAEGKALFLNSGTLGPRYATDPYKAFKSEIEPVIIPSPSGDKSAAHVLAKIGRASCRERV